MLMGQVSTAHVHQLCIWKELPKIDKENLGSDISVFQQLRSTVFKDMCCSLLLTILWRDYAVEGDIEYYPGLDAVSDRINA